MEKQMNVENVEDSNGKRWRNYENAKWWENNDTRPPPTKNPNKQPPNKKNQNPNLSKVYLSLLQILFAADAWISL